jgi:hypothetical protein
VQAITGSFGASLFVKGGIRLIAESSQFDSSRQLPAPRLENEPENAWQEF